MSEKNAAAPAAEFLPMLQAGTQNGFTRKSLTIQYPNLSERQIRTLTEKAEAQGLISRDTSGNGVLGTGFVVFVLTDKGRELLPTRKPPAKPATATKAPTKLSLVPIEEQVEAEEPGTKKGKKAKKAKAEKKDRVARPAREKKSKVPEGELPGWAEVPPTKGEGFTTEPETQEKFCVEVVGPDVFDVVVKGVGVIDRVRKVKSSRRPGGFGFLAKGDPNQNAQRTLTSSCRSSIRHWDRRGRKPLESARVAKGGGAPLTTF